MRFAFERSWWIGLDPDSLWDALADTRAYARWWPWLRDARLPELAIGSQATFVVAPPLPYRLHLHLDITDVTPGRRVAATVDGDLAGRAELSLAPVGRSLAPAGRSLAPAGRSLAPAGRSLAPAGRSLAPAGRSLAPAEGEGTIATLVWDLELRRRRLRALGGLARPVLEAGHERVVRSGVRSFARAVGAEIRELDGPTDEPARRRPVPTIVGDGAVAAMVAGVVSGAPSTLAALVSRRPILASTKAAGTLLGAPTLTRGVVAHGAVSFGWATGLAALWPRRAGIAASAAAGGLVGIGIAALDLGIIARERFPAVAALPVAAQVADHAVFGALVGATLAWRRRLPGRPRPPTAELQRYSRFPSGERQLPVP